MEVRIKDGRKQAQAALDEAKKTIKGITGLEVNDITTSADPNTNIIQGIQSWSKDRIWS